MKTSFQEKVLDAVLSLGECTAAQVQAIVGREISAAQAQTACRWEKKRRSRTQRRGRMILVAHALKRLAAQGKIQRFRRGVYAPLAPRLYNTA